MQAMNAIDALSPALHRWRQLVWDKFRVSRLLKLGFVALLAEVSSGGSSFNFNFPSGNRTGAIGHLPAVWRASLVTLIVGFAIVSFVVGVVIFYLSCRMKFAEFYIAATGDTRVGPPWSRYGRQTWQLFWLTIGIWFAALAALLVLMAPVFFMLLRHGAAYTRHMNPGKIFGLILLLLPLLLIWLLLLGLTLMVVRDLMLPAWALEGATIGQAWRWAKAVIESSPKQFAFYVLIKIGLHITAAIAGAMAFFTGVLVTAIPCTILGLGVWLSLRHAGPAGHIAMLALAIAGGLVVLVWIALLYIALIGGAVLVMQCYANYWVGSRYKPLGDLLEPPPAAPVMPVPEPPVMPSGGDGLAPPEDWTPVLG
jgi:hypothetical protein